MTSLKNKPFPFDCILQWYTKNGRHDLPWRQIYHLPTKDRLYRVWIAEVMLQQTQVDRVIGYYVRFLEKYPTIESLAETTYEELFPYWQGLGYYSRARRMIELAKMVIEKYDGIFPRDFEKLWKLPWIGIYTAQALLAFGYNESILALDANLEKIFSRYYLGTKHKEKSTKKKEWIWNNFIALISDLQEQVQKEKISGRDINNALMDFWALISTTFDKVDKDVYPLPECLWFQTEGKIEQEKREKRREKRGGLWNNSDSAPLSRGVPKAGGLKPAKLMVFLHENHKKYWSSHEKYYEPFLIEPIGKDDRKTIQDYFSATYGLEVSVRPSFGNAKLIPGRRETTPGLRIQNPGVLSVKLFHAQIQTGKISLLGFSKQEKGKWITKNILPSK